MLNFYFYHISLIIRNFLILKVANKNRNYREKMLLGEKSYNRSLQAFLRKTAEKSLKIYPDITPIEIPIITKLIRFSEFLSL